jgi:hypothetical protein
MSIDKWLSDEEWLEKKRKRDQTYKKLSKEEKKELELKSIKNLIGEEEDDSDEELRENQVKEDYFLEKIVEFKEWLDSRTYLKGDKSKIEMWVSNLHRILHINHHKANKPKEKSKKELIKDFRRIPPDFLDEQIRIAINKKLRGQERTRSDNYYLRKLRKEIEEKLKELKYYKILEDILDH